MKRYNLYYLFEEDKRTHRMPLNSQRNILKKIKKFLKKNKTDQQDKSP